MTKEKSVSTDAYVSSTFKNLRHKLKNDVRYSEDTRHSDETLRLIRDLAEAHESSEWLKLLECVEVSMSAVVAKLAEDIHKDIACIIPDNHREILQKTRVFIAPFANVNGHAISCTHQGHPLDEKIILINYGAFTACSTLAEALAASILANGRPNYEALGTSYFGDAKNFYMSTGRGYHERPEPNLPGDELGAIRKLGGELCSIMLQFIALHEFGHIVHHDETEQDAHTAEYQADEYAIQCLGRHGAQHPAAAANLAQVYLFLRWLEYVQAGDAKAQISHPPARERKNRIIKIAHSWSCEKTIREHANLIEALVDTWIRNIEDAQDE